MKYISFDIEGTNIYRSCIRCNCSVARVEPNTLNILLLKIYVEIRVIGPTFNKNSTSSGCVTFVLFTINKTLLFRQLKINCVLIWLYIYFDEFHVYRSTRKRGVPIRNLLKSNFPVQSQRTNFYFSKCV